MRRDAVPARDGTPAEGVREQRTGVLRIGRRPGPSEPAFPGRLAATGLAVLLAMALSLSLSMVLACRQPPASGSDVAVRIDGEEIHYGDFETYLRQNMDGTDSSLDSAVQSQLFDQYLDAQLLIRLAIERGLVEPGVDHRHAMAFLLRDDASEGFSEAELQAYYDAHRSQYQRPEEVHLRQILVEGRAAADQAHAAITAGEDFAEVAARISQEPRAHLGGDQGRLAREDLPIAYVDAIFALAPGEVTDVITADYGFHIFQVVKRYPAETLPLEAVADEIRGILDRHRLDERVAGFIHEARERYNVVVFPTNFPFEYQGDYAHPDTPPRSR